MSLLRLWRGLGRRRGDDAILREELSAHLQALEERYRAEGLSAEAARTAARRQFGNVTHVREGVREQFSFGVLENLGQDVRYALRQLRRAPSFTFTVTLTLALGIGATAAIFSLFNEALLHALPVSDPDRLVNLSVSGPTAGSHLGDLAAGDARGNAAFSYPMFRDLERLQTVFTGIAAHKGFDTNLSFHGESWSSSGLAVSGSYFLVLGVQPALGRLIGAGDDRIVGESDVVVLSHACWQRRFGGAVSVLNDTLVVNGRRMTIVGVAARGFDGTTLGRRPDVYVPITMFGQMNPEWRGFDDRRSHWAILFARLRPGVTLDQARAMLDATYQTVVNDVEAPLQSGMSDGELAQFKARKLILEYGRRGQSVVHGVVRTPLTLLLAVSGVVLLIACVNIANLLLARAATRATEMTVRLSLGASRSRLIVQLLTESCMLAVLGGMAGLVVARVTLSTIVSFAPEGPLARAAPTSLDTNVVLFAVAVTFATGLLFGLFPALHSTGSDLVSKLRASSGQPSGGRGAIRFRTMLATTQVALSMMLLVAAGLFIKSLIHVSRVNLGMTIEDLVTFSVAPELSGYTPQRAAVLYDRLQDELAALPGVTGVTGSFVAAVAGDNRSKRVRVEGFNGIDGASQYNEIASGYFSTMGIPLIAGREITRADGSGAPRVAVVNEAFAKRFGLGRNAVGAHMSWCCARDHNSIEKLDTEIVGLVRDAKYGTVKDDVPPVFYIPYRQTEDRGIPNIYVRTSFAPEQLLDMLPQLVAKLDSDLPINNVRTMAQQVRENVFLDWFIGTLSTAFAALATLLAATGLYGVFNYAVAQRTREIGLRMALGATPGHVRRTVLHQVALMTAVGGVLGLAGAVVLGRAAQALLFEITGHDPIVLTAAAVALSTVALTAGALPAARASRVDPMRALRSE
jgi:predicted permease